jgi:hypothetical protein
LIEPFASISKENLRFQASRFLFVWSSNPGHSTLGFGSHDQESLLYQMKTWVCLVMPFALKRKKHSQCLVPQVFFSFAKGVRGIQPCLSPKKPKLWSPRFFFIIATSVGGAWP